MEQKKLFKWDRVQEESLQKRLLVLDMYVVLDQASQGKFPVFKRSRLKLGLYLPYSVEAPDPSLLSDS
ncbi:hypothetical protein Pla110_16540 [Polystyrenella longa]|uniref:Uncharacterized protein n=1 Tax=Polystyrenella longa TaxID=2528007 RepID=A0A518CL79_9PLAN|nr:hypothetical protein Pla110_16540 [Polystyrenella longa]